MLLKYCIEYYSERAKQAQDAINMAQESANDETKSSAGDKYETSRAMSHIARDMYAKNLDIAIKTIQFLKSIQLKITSKIELGSVVKTTNGVFFIASSIGIVQLEGLKYTIISLASPIGKILENKKVGDIFIHNNVLSEVLDIK